MIGVTRVSAVWCLQMGFQGVKIGSQCRRRIWLLDRQAGSIGAELRDDLGDWIRRRLKTIESQAAEAQKKLEECGIPIHELRDQWELQRAAQLSLRARQCCR